MLVLSVLSNLPKGQLELRVGQAKQKTHLPTGQAIKHACSFSSFQLTQRTSRVKSGTRNRRLNISHKCIKLFFLPCIHCSASLRILDYGCIMCRVLMYALFFLFFSEYITQLKSQPTESQPSEVLEFSYSVLLGLSNWTGFLTYRMFCLFSKFVVFGF